MSYIGLDVGTSGCKAAVVEKNGRIRLQASRTYRLLYSRTGWVELDPVQVWEAVLETLEEIAPQSYDAHALAVASIGEALVLLDEKDAPVMNSITYLDQRCARQPELIRQRFDEVQLRQITGMPLDQTFSLNKYLWMADHCPEVLERAKHIFLFGDYISYMLTGECAIDPASASRTMLFDRNQLYWSREISERFGVDLGKFSAVMQTGELIGPLRKRVSFHTGLPSSLCVYVGSHDQCCATLGAGAVSHGDIMMGMGSSGSMNVVLAGSSKREGLNITNTCVESYIVPQTSLALMGQRTYGTGIKWFAHQFEPQKTAECETSGENIYQWLDSQCPDSPTQIVFLPHLAGNSMQNVGSFAAFSGIELSSDRYDLYRALLEGLCFETRTNLERLEHAGVCATEIIATGGCANSSLLLQMQADILGKTVKTIRSQQAGIMGLGMICAVADRDYMDYAEAAATFVQPQNRYQPDSKWKEKYEKNYTVYRRLDQLT